MSPTAPDAQTAESTLVVELFADAYRVTGSWGWASVARTVLASPISRFLVVLRIGSWSTRSGRRRAVRLIAGAAHRHYRYRYGLEIPYTTSIGPGLKLVHHAGGFVVSAASVIGKNCTLLSGVTIGETPAGSPIVGADVTVSPGARIIGPVTVGNGSQVAPNAVVVRHVAPGVVVGGVPARELPGSVPQAVTNGAWRP